MSKSLAYIPQTPSSSKLLQTNYTPQHSSPLAPMDLTVVPSSPGPPSSPVSEVQSRRRAQYKSRTPSASRAFHSQIKLKPPRTRPSSIIGSSRTYGFDQHDLPPIPFALSPAPRTVNTEEGQKEFLRERFKAKCFARARKVHDRELQRRRSASSDASSDGIDFDMDTIDGEDEEDEDKAALNDEIFRRIVACERRKTQHQYALSYQLEVGSSIDPDMQDIAAWEEELRASNSNSNHSPSQEEFPDDDIEENIDAYLEDLAELEEYEFDEANALFDEYIANLPLDAELEHQSLQRPDISRISVPPQESCTSTPVEAEMDLSMD